MKLLGTDFCITGVDRLVLSAPMKLARMVLQSVVDSEILVLIYVKAVLVAVRFLREKSVNKTISLRQYCFHIWFLIGILCLSLA